jgi:hypothetical protein
MPRSRLQLSAKTMLSVRLGLLSWQEGKHQFY